VSWRSLWPLLATAAGAAVVFAAVLVLWPQGEAGDYGVPDLFPRDVAAQRRFAPLDVPRDAFPSESRTERTLRSIEAVWRRVFRAAGDEYEPAKLVVAAEALEDACEPPGDWAGLYCMEDATIYLDLEASDTDWAYVLAHEVGHHVQAQRGVFDATNDEYIWHTRTSHDVSRREELQAQCFAGIWAYAVRAPAPPDWFYEAPEGQGSPREHATWFRRGRRTGRPAACDTFTTPA
jgi:predicted metalloprotease